MTSEQRFTKRGSATSEVRGGVLEGGLPFLSLGTGPPLVVLAGLDVENSNPVGMARRWEMRRFRRLAEHFTVYSLRRRPGLLPGCTMEDLAGEVATALAAEFDGPVDVEGISTGGSIALQLALDHPGLVRRLVLLASAGRLSDSGRRLQRQHAELVRAHRYRQAWQITAPAMAVSRVGQTLAAAASWLAGPALAPRDPSDLLRTIEAEDGFDVTDRLSRLIAPTLVIGGDRDAYYCADLFTRTASGVAHGHLLMLTGRGHAATVLSRRATEAALAFLVGPPASPGRTAAAAVRDVAIGGTQVLAAMLAAPVLGRLYNSWGATPAEVRAPLPGDKLVPNPRLGYTRAITIHAVTTEVWPWLVQVGHGRGGLYSFDGLENLVGCDLHSADVVLPEHQDLQPGDLVRLGPPGYPCFRAVQVVPPTTLVLVGADPRRPHHAGRIDGPNATWQWMLRPVERGLGTRLLVRQRLTYHPAQAVLWRLIQPVTFVMERQMLLRLRDRAERPAEPR